MRLQSLIRLALLLLLLFISSVTFCQEKVKIIGNVHYTTVSLNQVISKRNDSIAFAINNYLKAKAPSSFPPVVLYISDQDSMNKLSNFEDVKVYYQRFKGQFFDEYASISINEPYLGIHLTLYKNHFIWGMKAIEFAIKHLDELKKKEKLLAKKNNKDKLTEKDLNSYSIYGG